MPGLSEVSQSVQEHADRFGNLVSPSATEPACPVCRSSRSVTFAVAVDNHYQWWDCRECGLRFSEPMESGGAGFYQAQWSYSPSIQRMTKRLSTTATVWEYRTILEYSAAAGSTLLDIGCGSGEFLFLAQQRYGYSVTGIDFNADAVEAAHSVFRLNVVHGTWPEAAASLPERSFDRVTMLHSLEHVADPLAAIRSATSALNTGGYLCLAVPAAHRRPALYFGDRDLPPHHLTLWSERSLAKAMESAGLKTAYLARRPLQAGDFLAAWQDRFPALRQPRVHRLYWGVFRRLLAAPVAGLRSLTPTVGCVVVGIGQRQTSRGA
jgi:2-polyprenyl-3-methyl-5-hydroxy-6-metoxy-1,4-benzoquinol methylase